MIYWIILTAVVGIVLGLVIGFLLQKNKLVESEVEVKTLKEKVAEKKEDLEKKDNEFKEHKNEMEKNLKKEIENLRKEYELKEKQIILDLEKEIDNKFKSKNQKKHDELNQLDKKLRTREDNLDNGLKNLDKRDSNLDKRETNLDKREEHLKELEKDLETQKNRYNKLIDELSAKKEVIVKELEKVAGLTQQEARERLDNLIIDEAKRDAAKKVQKIISETQEQATEKAQKIISIAIQRYAGEYITEKSVSVVHLSRDDMKGRIIGREGRNIRAFESATGVDLIIDETPEAVILSSFNPIRREVAKLSLEKLIEDGRIHPARIEEIVAKVEKEVEEGIIKSGNDALMELNILPNMNVEIIKLIGALKYRTSYGQNQLQHSIEVGFLCGMMAEEMGINPKLARRAGLLHDIGKAVDHEVEGSHAVIGADLAKRYGEKPEIVHAIKAHHNDVPPETALAFLVDASDALSGARPGARRETMQAFIKRLEDIETICQSFSGVQKSFAIQAGREVRVIVEHEEINDEQAGILSRELAKKIEQNVTYPGQIKIVVIRERRVVTYAS
jgi:ribonuclease Y